MACRAVSLGNADGVRHADLPERTGEGDRPHLVYSAHHELGRQLRFTGDVAFDPRIGAARIATRRLVASGAARVAERGEARRDVGINRDRAYRDLAAVRPV